MSRAAASPRPQGGRWKRRQTAAEYLDVSPLTFDKWVIMGRMPQPYMIEGIKLWDATELDAAVRDLHEAAVLADDADGWG